MTLDDLEKVFWGDQREQPTRVRLARVVRAMRNSFDMQLPFEVSMTIDEILLSFDKILGGDAEAAAGGPAREDGPGGVEQAVPAVTPAAGDVCEWTDMGPEWHTSCGAAPTAWVRVKGERRCSDCLRPISFKELAP